jgi:hypothetical protein
MDGRIDQSSPAISLIVTAGLAACTLLWAATPGQTSGLPPIDFVSNGIGVPPADFEFWRAGSGALGEWAVVRDASAAAGASIEQFSTDLTEDRFPLAVYKPISARDIAVSVRFKIVRGSMRSAGIAVRLKSAGDYYAVRASALETRVDLLRVAGGRLERIAGVDADVVANQWHTLGVVAENDRFTISLDNAVILAVRDQTLAGDGHVALWTENDNVTRFDSIAIEPLPPSAGLTNPPTER